MTAPHDVAELTFVGTATTVLRLGPFTLLTDPNFLRRGQRAYLGKGLWSPRLTDPAVRPHQLSALDAVVLSHLHGDHFDRVARRELSRDQPVLTTTAAARKLERWGFAADGLDTWDARTLTRDEYSLTVHALPGVHARGLLRYALPPVMGSMLELRRSEELLLRLYVSGDTLPGAHLDPVRERFPTVDAAVLHLGGTRVLLHTVTADAPMGLQIMDQVRPGLVVPVHHDDYRVFRDPLGRFLDLADATGAGHLVRAVRRGGTTSLPLRGPDRA